jgi:hypothetical protein
MIATCPMDSAFLKKSDRTADPRHSHKKSKETLANGLDCDRNHRIASGFPEGDDDDYHLGRLIYTL